MPSQLDQEIVQDPCRGAVFHAIAFYERQTDDDDVPIRYAEIAHRSSSIELSAMSLNTFNLSSGVRVEAVTASQISIDAARAWMSHPSSLVDLTIKLPGSTLAASKRILAIDRKPSHADATAMESPFAGRDSLDSEEPTERPLR